MKKYKFLSLFLVLFTVAFMLPLSVFYSFADDEFTEYQSSGNWNFRVNNSTNEAMITSYHGTPVDISIPDELNGYTVTAIGSGVFKNCTDLKSVKIPETVTDIGNEAFMGCSVLSFISIPDGVINIGKNAFYNSAYYNATSNWEEQRVPMGDGHFIISYSALYIGNHLIDVNNDVSEFTVRSGTKSIASSAFVSCDVITSVIIPDGVTSIGNDAFWFCETLESVTIPKSVTNIGSGAFEYCSSLTIYGYRGSYAETYANENDIPFVAFDEPSIVQFDKSQIRFRGVGADKDFSNYKDTFDVRTVAKISQDDFRNTFGTDEEAIKNITDIGFIYAAEMNVTSFDIETAKKVAEGTVTDENYIKKPVSYIQHAGDGADYVFTCIVTNVPDNDREQKGYCFAYVSCNGTYYYFDDVTVMDFNTLYMANRPQD